MDLKDLYRDVILDHNRSPRNFGRLPDANATAEGFNPLCGDRLTLQLRIEDQRIVDAKFEGKGCAISTASVSMMTEAIIGSTEQQARSLFGRVHALLTGSDTTANPEDLGKLAALSGVREFPARVKCASLCWHTLMSALDHQSQPVSTE